MRTHKPDQSDEEEARELMEERSKEIEIEINSLKESNKGRVGNVFKLAKSIHGNKKGYMEAQAVKDPRTGELVVSDEEIKKAVLTHCTDILHNNEPGVKYAKEIEIKETLHDIRMKSQEQDGFEIGKGLFNKVMNKFRKAEKRTMTSL